MQSPPRQFRSYQPRQPRVQQRQHPRRHHTSTARTDPADWFTTLLASDLFQQVAPFVVLFVIPLLVLATNRYKRTIFWPLYLLVSRLSMVLESFSGALPWNWFSGSGRTGPHGKERKGKKVVRTRAEQLAMREVKDGQDGQQTYGDVDSDEDEGEDGYYPGIVNISGTYCFMDSTLQALASLNYLQPYIDAIHGRAEALDVPTPVVDALRDILHQLNTPQSSRRALRPLALIQALSAPPTSKSSARGDRLFSSREHQDAQELFQVLVEAVKSEAAEVGREGARDLGLGGALASTSQLKRAKHDLPPESEVTKSVFDGLTANRRSCISCGYTEAVMHFAFDSWQLALPARGAACQLQDCLADYTRLEVLTDCMCRRCSLMATYEKYAKDGEVPPASSPATPLSASPSSSSTHDNDEKATISKSKKKRHQEARKLANRIKALLDEGRVEEDVKGVQIVKVFKTSTKQAMIARPPPVLVLHLNRSIHFGGYYDATKNNCRVTFPEILDISPFTTSGTLSIKADAPISRPKALPKEIAIGTLYRLAAVVCHYGHHSAGHYVCFRRKPRPPRVDERKRWAPPGWKPGQENSDLESKRGTGRGWLRISDDDVRECGIESVLQEGVGAFMLFYEKVVLDGSTPVATSSTSEPNHTTVAPTPSLSSSLPNGTLSGIRPLPLRSTVGSVIQRHPYANGLDSDDDATPRCSEETLKPSKIKPNSPLANGSDESLASTLVSISTLSMSGSSSLSSSPSKSGTVGQARVVRSVSLARTFSEKSKSEVNGHAIGGAESTPMAGLPPLPP